MGKGCLPATHTADINSLQRPKSPLTRNHPKMSDQFAAPQTPINGATSTSVPPSILEDPQKSGQEVKPQHVHNPQQQVKSSTTGQQLPAPRLPENAPPQRNVILNDTPSLVSSSASEHDPPVGFFTARAAESLQKGPGLPLKASVFDPHLQSPSIRKTAGVDHTKTKPVGRETVGAPSQPTLPRANFVNPQSDKTRRVGMPAGAACPLQNRGSYKPPQMKRAVESSGPRSALGDVTNVASDGGGDVKRQKLGLEAQVVHSNDGTLNS